MVLGYALTRLIPYFDITGLFFLVSILLQMIGGGLIVSSIYRYFYLRFVFTSYAWPMRIGFFLVGAAFTLYILIEFVL